MRPLTLTTIILLAATITLPGAVADHPTSKTYVGHAGVGFTSTTMHDDAIVCIEGATSSFEGATFRLVLRQHGTTVFDQTFRATCAIVATQWNHAVVQVFTIDIDVDTLDTSVGEPIGTVHLHG